MTRTSTAVLAIAACGALLSACGGDDSDSAAPSPSAGAVDQAVDNAKAGTFVASFRGAFPKLAEGKDDSAVAAIFTDTCADITAGKSEDDIVASTEQRASGASHEQAQAVYQTVKMLCSA
ncbi:hypothetical protein GCM10023318_37160 [Nocardia callitridis]|uniref:Lipoprotein n=1 Tax=Nocardia callitridis TaxID=648753 RepID=A0ABP9KG85_9NOCA